MEAFACTVTRLHHERAKTVGTEICDTNQPYLSHLISVPSPAGEISKQLDPLGQKMPSSFRIPVAS